MVAKQRRGQYREPLVFCGVGLYGVASASRLTGIPAANIRRWLYGYQRAGKWYEPLWQDQLSQRDLDAEGLGFLDLIGIQVVRGLRKHGVSMASVRLALKHAEEMYGMDRPFAHQRFFTDGEAILMAISSESGDRRLIDLCRRQLAMADILKPFLKGVIEYADEVASLWFPMPGSRDVVVDPNRAFGRPILANWRIPTETLHLMYLAERKDAGRVAAVYEIPEDQVQAAVRYEEFLDAAA